MAYSRYEERSTKDNKDKLYSKHLQERGVKKIKHHTTPTLGQPSTSEMAALDVEVVLWKRGDRYWKLAEQFYGNAQLWWVIAWYNKKPTEADVALNDTILIPQPLEKVLSLFGV